MTGRPSGARRQRSAQTRARLLDAAMRLFAAHGYDGTTVDAIAREAGVAVQTVYFKFGSKTAILKELLDVRVAGDDEPIPTVERPWFRAAVEAADPRVQLRLQVDAAREIYARVGAVVEVVRSAAAGHEEIAALWETNKRQRYEVQALLTRALADKHALPAGMSREHATDIAYTLLGPEVYHLMVGERGWLPEEWADWAHAGLCRHLLGEN